MKLTDKALPKALNRWRVETATTLAAAGLSVRLDNRLYGRYNHRDSSGLIAAAKRSRNVKRVRRASGD